MSIKRKTTNEEEDVSLLKLGSDFTDAPCLLNSEVAILLEYRKERERDAELSNMFNKTLAYAERFSRNKNKTSVKEIRGLLEQQRGDFRLRPYEVASIANLCPEAVDEAKSLIPSLSIYNDDDLSLVLADLASFKRFD
eukprot:TRINITY_DN1256_c0_g1_i1.p1 TRINITY_DN1256_c0_g1~~TRINITY_DN1256_c0_g1_i1.p1  ORF type:complete len:138 (-),score=37.40 TRINITY_DN1256_c0_g1_i1:44-457(-)